MEILIESGGHLVILRFVKSYLIYAHAHVLIHRLLILKVLLLELGNNNRDIFIQPLIIPKALRPDQKQIKAA